MAAIPVVALVAGATVLFQARQMRFSVLSAGPAAKVRRTVWQILMDAQSKLDAVRSHIINTHRKAVRGPMQAAAEAAKVQAKSRVQARE